MHLTPSWSQWGPAASERFPLQTAFDIPIDTQIQEALIERAVAYSLSPVAAYSQAPGHVIALDTPEMPLVQQLWHARQLTSRLSRSKAAQFSVIRKLGGAQLQATELGHEVVQLLSSSVGTVGQQYPCHVLEPRIELLLECAAKRNLLPLWPPFVLMEEARLLPLVDSLNGFAQDVRRRGSAASFKTKVANFQAQTDQRYKAMQNYFRQLCTLYPDGHVIRMDFSYLPHQTVGFAFGEEMHQTVTLHGQALLEHLAKTLGSAVVGYAWKRDFAAARGYQHHLVAILNGPQFQELHGIEQSLGEHWSQAITGGKGLWVNCQGAWGNNFRYRGMNAFTHCSGSMEDRLSLAPVFMALTDGIAAFTPMGKAKPYGMGTLPAGSRKKAARKGSQHQATENWVSSGSWPFSV
ncbi:MAG: hypothetical protein V4542_04000 [Pseudomonadota bacterium]